MLEVRSYIAGEWFAPDSGQAIEVRNPADWDDVLGSGYLAGVAEAEAAVAAAEAVRGGWAATPVPKRGEIIERAADILKSAQDDLAHLLTREEGKTLADARSELYRAYNVLNYVAAECRRPAGNLIPSELERNLTYTVRQPLGVVALITPWNFPVAIPAWKIAPALAAGNTVVFKPSSTTPLTAARLVEIFEQAGTPPGALNLLVGSSAEVGNRLTDDRRIRGISFTGSSENGTRVYTACANRAAKAQCEMGGKNPVLVLEDADLDLAADGIVSGAFGSTGQRCTATSRAVIEEAIADEMIEKIVGRVSEWKVGNGLNPEIQMGPLVSEAQLRTVEEYIDIGRSEGATLVCGGKRIANLPGFFIEPTVFDRVGRSYRIAQEEIFGPVLSVTRVGNYDEGLAAVNDSRYGLAGSIYSTDNARVFDFCERAEVGMVHVNSPTVGGEAQMPFGGIKNSGIGDREQGTTALDFYSDLKVVYVDYTGRARKSKFY